MPEAHLIAPTHKENTMILHVNYTVPVVAVVDTDAGTIDQVVIVDEEIKLDGDYGNRGVSVDAAEPASDTDADAALALAEGPDALMWPGWDFGF
jgi:hypothetical protein